MKTPVNILITAIAYWIVLYAVTLVPLISKSYHLNLIWFTVVIPNVIRFAADVNKKLKLSALLAGTFAMGALGTYYSGIDNSIYSNMGWERPV